MVEKFASQTSVLTTMLRRQVNWNKERRNFSLRFDLYLYYSRDHWADTVLPPFKLFSVFAPLHIILHTVIQVTCYYYYYYYYYFCSSL